MEVTQTYARPSAATLEHGSLTLDVAAEQSRPEVSLDATVGPGPAYARAMAALRAVVVGDQRPAQRDHADYQRWVQERYLDELQQAQAESARHLPGLLQHRAALRERIGALEREARDLNRRALKLQDNPAFRRAQMGFFGWLWTHAKELSRVLDPVVSVHPDGVFFEAFSQDESSYGRVSLPLAALEAEGDVRYGTTNIDFSAALAREVARVRTYRPARLRIGAESVALATGAGSVVEKKIDLPPTWVRGFLQVQSAAALPGTDLRLSAGTVADVLTILGRRRERAGPRSLRFLLAPGERPRIVVEPWDVVIAEPVHAYDGPSVEPVRVWGRRRLVALRPLLPHADEVRVRLLGSGLPSFWSAIQGGVRFDLGLSGWTTNDWARSANFDLLASTGGAEPREVVRAALLLEAKGRLAQADVAAEMGTSREAAAAALQRLCREGRAMYDHIAGIYRWRQLFPAQLRLEEEAEDPRTGYARQLLARGAVEWAGPPRAVEGAVRYAALVHGERDFEVTLELDADGRARYAQCTCSAYRRDKLRKGPCQHILAAGALAAVRTASAADVEPVHG